MAALQRLLSVAPESCVHGTWYEADIGSSSSTAASMTGIERGTVIQRGRPLVPPPTRGRMSAARRVELTLSNRRSHRVGGNLRRKGAVRRLWRPVRQSVQMEGQIGSDAEALDQFDRDANRPCRSVTSLDRVISGAPSSWSESTRRPAV